MKNSPLLKYKIGLSAIGVLSLVLLIIVVVQAGGVKKDAEIYKNANKVAERLDDYVNSKGKVPASLSAAGIADVPEEVSYQKISDTKYKFCVTYNSDSTGFDATYLETQLMTGGHAEDYYGTSDEESSYLYLDEYHHKGENCKHIKTYSYTDYDYDYNYDDSSYPSDDYYNFDEDTQSL